MDFKSTIAGGLTGIVLLFGWLNLPSDQKLGATRAELEAQIQALSQQLDEASYLQAKTVVDQRETPVFITPAQVVKVVINGVEYLQP